MTPAKRKRLTKQIFIMALALSAAVIGRFLFLNQSIPSLIMGRKPGAAAPGTVLVKEKPIATTTNTSASASTKIDPEDSSEPMNLKFDVLTSWVYDEKNPAIPGNVKSLDGKEIEITGFMLPVNETQNITRFVLVNSLWGCCFGQAPAVNHVIVVTMKPGKVVDFYPDPVKVRGRFFVGETREEGFLVSVFRMEGKQVVVR